MKVQALRNNHMAWAKVHGFDGDVSVVCDAQIYHGCNGWELIEAEPMDISCERCARKMFPAMPSMSDMRKLEAWVNGRPIT